MHKHSVIVRPIITEKSMSLAGVGKFSFVVASHASKNMIRQAIQDMFSVSVTDVATATVKGKTKRVGKRREEVVITPLKKAVISVKKGQKIDIFEIGS
jgi:large subunit ribosomal protein L23